MAKKLGTLASSKISGRDLSRGLKLTFSGQSSNYNNLKSLLAELRVSIVEMKCKVSDLHNDRAGITLIKYLL